MNRVRSIGTGCLLAVSAALWAQDAALPGRRDRLQALAQSMPGQMRPSVGLAFQLRAADGRTPAAIEIFRVLPGSPAAQAGLQPGDLILSVRGQAVTTGEAFQAAMAQPGPAVLEVLRKGAPLRITLQVPEPPPAPVSADPYTVPGQVPSSTQGINTLRTVFLDPKTGRLAFIGSRDPAYATGPIDYAELLGDALRSPYPAFSLDPSPATRSTREALLRKVDGDMARMQKDIAFGKAWMLRMGNQLLTDPALELDRQRFLKKGAAAMRSTPEQVRAFWDLVSERMTPMGPQWVETVAKLFEGMGDVEMGRALRAMGSPESQAQAFSIIGLGPLLDDLRMKIQTGAITGDRALALGQAAFWERALKGLRAPEASWRPAVDQVRAGRISVDAFLVQASNAMSQAITDRVMTPWLNGLVLSQAFLERFYQVPPIEVVPSFLGGLAPDSGLARTFFAADWSLKMLAISPELADKVPGHLTYQNHAFRMGTPADSRGSIRAWLTPQGVELRHDPAGNTLSFGPSRIAIRSELTSYEGGSRPAGATERQAAESYAQEVTRRYDDYARALPELHRLREAAKVIALVRWAKGRGLTLAPPATATPTKPLPASFRQGFWTATMLVDATRFVFVISAHGGVDFDAKAGDAWVQPKAEPGLGDSALKQLVGSAALAQQAADAALKGDLEGARELAQRSELAMIGDLRSGFPALAAVPQVPEPAAYAAFQSQALAQSREALDGLRQAKTEAERKPWEDKLRNLRDLMAQGQRTPGSAAELVVQLQPGAMGVITPGPATPAPPHAAPAPVPPAPVTPPTVAATPAQPASAVPPEERARLRNEITQLRSELCRIQAQLRRLNATIQMDQGQRAEWERVTNEAYERALDEVKEALMDELKDLSMDLPKGYLEDKLEKAATPADKERIQRSLRLVQRLKESYDLKDFSVWASYEDYSRDEIIEGAKMVAELTGLDEWIKNKLVKKWGLGRVLAFGEAAQDIVASAYDVTSEVLAWRRLGQLNRNSDAFLKAVESTSRRMQIVMESIQARELRLGLPPGASRTPCP